MFVFVKEELKSRFRMHYVVVWCVLDRQNKTQNNPLIWTLLPGSHVEIHKEFI